jgi:hypothetical protein
MASAMTQNAKPSLGTAGKSQPGGGTVVTGPPRDHGKPQGGSPDASGMYGVKQPLPNKGVGNNDKNKAK